MSRSRSPWFGSRPPSFASRPPSSRSRSGSSWPLLLVALALAGCSGGGPTLANRPVVRPEPPPSPSQSPAPHDPLPITFPRDDGPHHRLTEWWYYTGHLVADDGRRFGFEFVVFRAERGGFPLGWASHVALTDEGAGRFHYAQRNEVGPQVDHSPTTAGSPDGFALTLSAVPGALASPGPATALPPPSDATPWSMAGTQEGGRLIASASAGEVANGQGAFGLDLSLGSGPVVLQHQYGFVDFGAGGGSYYYSRPRQPVVRGTVTVGGQAVSVRGTAWFDHEWGDFVSIGGGWQWFAINLSDGRSITLWLVRDATGSPVLGYGTLVAASTIHLTQAGFEVAATGNWRSPHTRGDYPAGWRVAIPQANLLLDLVPTLPDQELDARSTTGEVYWEGSQRVTVRSSSGVAIPSLSGEAYVELTGYAPAGG